jgi:hypothetical protein
MKTYKGIVRNNKVIFEEKVDIKDGSEVLVLVKPSEIEDEEITKRQIEMLKRGFKMGRILYPSREELYE